jgi:hypothetical protein
MHEGIAGSNISPTAHSREERELVTKWLFARRPSPPATGRRDRCKQSSPRPSLAVAGAPVVARRPRRRPGRKCSSRSPRRSVPSGAANWLTLAAARPTSQRHELAVHNERPCPKPDRTCCSIRFHSVSLCGASTTIDHAPGRRRLPVSRLTPSCCRRAPPGRQDTTQNWPACRPISALPAVAA